MPTYGYRCPKCSTEFEVWQTMRDDPVAACPSCDAEAARQFFPAGIVFKGSGFYKTDSRGASSSSITSDSGDSGKSTAAPAKTESTKSETKSAASSDTSTSTTKSASTDSTS